MCPVDGVVLAPIAEACAGSWKTAKARALRGAVQVIVNRTKKGTKRPASPKSDTSRRKIHRAVSTE